MSTSLAPHDDLATIRAGQVPSTKLASFSYKLHITDIDLKERPSRLS